MLISLTLAPLAKTQLKSEFLPILLRVNAYQCCIPFCFSTEQNRTNRLSSIMFDCRTNRTPIERLGSIGFWFGFVRLATPGDLCPANQLVYQTVQSGTAE